MNLNLSTIKYAVTKLAGRPGLLAVKHSPEILIVVGTVGVAASIYTACRATLKAETLKEKYQHSLDAIHDAEEAVKKGTIDPEDYTEEDVQKDLLTVYVQRTVALAKLYGPSVGLALFSIACFVGSHKILSQRNMAFAAAYKVLSDSYKYYRSRVVEEYGPEKDNDYRRGVFTEKVKATVIDENGKKKKVERTETRRDDRYYSDYARFFDEYSHRWTENNEYNLMFLKTQQNFANDLLRARGHIFLNEVYDMLGMDHTSEGSLVGWVYNSEKGDDFVDFDIYNIHNNNFVNGRERAVLLDFNVQGSIWNLI